MTRAPAPLLPDDEDLDAPEAMIGAAEARPALHQRALPAPCALALECPSDPLGAARALASLGATARYLLALPWPAAISWRGGDAARARLLALGWPSPPTAQRDDAPAPIALEVGPVEADGDADALLTRASPEALALLFLGHPRQRALRLTEADVDAAQQRLEYLYDALHRINLALAGAVAIPDRGHLLAPIAGLQPRLFAQLHEGFGANLDPAPALPRLEALARGANELNQGARKPSPDLLWTLAAARSALVQAAAPLGLLQRYPEDALRDLQHRRAALQETPVAQIEALIQRRQEARAARDFATADALMRELQALRVEVMDNPTGSSWRLRP
jgi:hypothetical protein